MRAMVRRIAGLSPMMLSCKLTGQLKSALIGLDRGHPLFIAVSALVGDNPDQELAVVDPETGRVLAYLLPAAQRHAVFAAAPPV